MSGACENNASIYEYKKCMEEVMVENPDLSVGAQQQLALKRCSKPNKKSLAKQSSLSDRQGILRGLMSGLNFGKNKGASSWSAGAFATLADEPVASESEDAQRSTFDWSTQESDCDAEDRRKKLAAIRQRSVATFHPDTLASSVNSSEDGSGASLKGSLADSLANIDNPTSFFEDSSIKRSSKIGGKSHLASMASSMLPYVEEDEESDFESSNSRDSSRAEEEDNRFRGSSSLKNASASSDQQADVFEDSVAVVLPDSITHFLNNKQEKRASGRRCNSSVSDGRRNNEPSSAQSSQLSSSLNQSLFDSKTFEGDFSAWDN